MMIQKISLELTVLQGKRGLRFTKSRFLSHDILFQTSSCFHDFSFSIFLNLNEAIVVVFVVKNGRMSNTALLSRESDALLLISVI